MEIIRKENITEIWLSKEGEKPTVLSVALLKSIETEINELEQENPVVILVPSGIAGANIKEMVSMTKNRSI
mgnify:FL=1